MVGLPTKLYYGFGSVAYGVKDNGFSFFLLIYYNQVLGLDAQLAGLAILIALVFDAISDPLVGHFSDNLHSKWGRRHPFMYGAAVPVAIAYYFLWNPPTDMSQTALFIYLVVTAVIIRLLITMYEIPSTSMVAELTEDYDERTSMLSFRYFFGWAGGLSLAVLAYSVFLKATEDYPIGQLNPDGYSAYGLAASLMIFIAIMVSALGTHKHIPHMRKPPPKKPFSFTRTFTELKETLSNKSFGVLFAATIFHAMASGLNASMDIYVNTYFWGLGTEQILLITLSIFLSAGIALFLSPLVSKKLGKKIGAMTMTALGFLMIPLPILLSLVGLFPGPGSPALLPSLLIFKVVDVACIIAAQTLFSAMIADVVEESEIKTGRRSEGVFFAARTFVYKSVNGIGIFLASALLAFIQFPDDAKPGMVDREIIVNMGVYLSVTVIVLYSTMIYIMSRYQIDREVHEQNLQTLQSRTAES